MKSKLLIAFLVFCLAGICSQLSFSQAQQEKPQSYLIQDIVVRPPMAARMDAVIKREMEMNFPIPWNTYSSDDFHYYRLWKIENYAGVDGFFKAAGEWEARTGESYKALARSAEGTFDSYKFGVIHLVPELSYTPLKPRLKPEEVNFIYWGLAYVEYGKEKEFEDVLKQFVALYTSQSIPIGFTVYAGDMGTEGPFYFWRESGKSAAEFWSEAEKAEKILGEKSTVLWNRALMCLRKYEFKTGRPRPDLSLAPKKK